MNDEHNIHAPSREGMLRDRLRNVYEQKAYDAKCKAALALIEGQAAQMVADHVGRISDDQLREIGETIWRSGIKLT